MKRFAIAIPVFLTVACVNGREPASMATAPFSQADADRISDECGADRAWLIVERGGAVRFEPPMEANYDASACILELIKGSGVTKFGFVGNDKAAPVE